jgi:hypothetical protein
MLLDLYAALHPINAITGATTAERSMTFLRES